MRVTVVSAGERVRVVGTTLGHLHRPHLLEAWGQRFNLQIDDPHLTLFRYSDVPGMIGRVGTSFGEHGINISAAAVGRQAAGEDGGRSDLAVMAVTTDAPCRTRSSPRSRPPTASSAALDQSSRPSGDECADPASSLARRRRRPTWALRRRRSS